MRKKAFQRVIVGLGATGLACARYLAAQDIPFAITDTREHPPQYDTLKTELPNVPVFLGELNIDCLTMADQIILSPGVSVHEPVIAKQIQRGAEVISEIELFSRVVTAPVIAITGSNGKSTVTAWVGEMAKAAGINVAVGGNFGPPALSLLEQNNIDLYVLELSSFQLQTTYSLAPAVAVVLNISPDHLDHHQDMSEYLAAKLRCYDQAYYWVTNRDDPLVTPSVKLSEQRHVSFGLSPGGDQAFGLLSKENKTYLSLGTEPWLSTDELRLAGKHQWANALAALAIGQAYGFPKEAMLKALREFKGLPHRCEWITTKNEISWYNDSKATNVSATEAALQGLGQTIKGRIVLIAGGQAKGADLTPLQSPVKDYVKHLILLGEDAPALEAALKSVVSISGVSDLKEAVTQAAEWAEPGDVVLLSPACASFDAFKNYVERGNVFVETVKEQLACLKTA